MDQSDIYPAIIASDNPDVTRGAYETACKNLINDPSVPGFANDS